MKKTFVSILCILGIVFGVGGDYTFWGVPGGDICGSNCLQSPLHK